MKLDISEKTLDIIANRINQSIVNFQSLLENDALSRQINDVAQLIIDAVKIGNKLIICGNGGSAADAQHMAGEFICKFYQNRQPLPAVALTTDTSIITAISNDYSYNDIFSRQVRALGKKGDVLLGISTSGSSVNVLESFKTAQEMGIKTVLLTGQTEKEIAKFSDIVIITPSGDTPRIQEMHLLIEHIICEIVENQFL